MFVCDPLRFWNNAYLKKEKKLEENKQLFIKQNLIAFFTSKTIHHSFDSFTFFLI